MYIHTLFYFSSNNINFELLKNKLILRKKNTLKALSQCIVYSLNLCWFFVVIFLEINTHRKYYNKEPECFN